VVGVLLLFVARGLQRRLDGAFVIAVVLLGTGAVFSVLKGGDWEEATILLVILGLMLPCREFFYRRASLLDARFNAGWIAAIAVVLLATLWLGAFAYRHVEYRNELWWRFALRGDAPRFLRASVAMLAVTAAIGVRHLLHPAVARPPAASALDLERAAAILPGADDCNGHLALVGDKSLLFSPTGRTFLMYGVERRTWIAMGDPIGPREEWEDLLWTFREQCDHHGARAACYEVGADELPLYLDLGMTLTKLGEEAHVPLQDFTLERPEFKGLRQTLRRMENENVRFEWIDRERVPPLLPELRAVSDAWLAAHQLNEKGFSIGYFSAAYLRRTPVAVARRGDEIVAFANVWDSCRQELSIDLMRYRESAPPRAMEFLLTALMQEGAARGYARFSLGMAPLSGMDTHALAPLRRRVGALVYQHGESFYHFQGLRAFKEKYAPIWSPRYLASPGGLALPLVVASVTRLISSGPKPLPEKTETLKS
jgi:phosphatidylglycerol lysyltransferase